MLDIPEIPSNAASHMADSRKQQIQKLRQRSISQSSECRHWQMPSSRSVSDFLQKKVENFRCDLEYIQSVQDGLNEARQSGLGAQEYTDALAPFLEGMSTIITEQDTVLKQKKIIEEDLEDEARKRIRTGEPNTGLLERAYTNTLVPKVMSAKQPRKKFNEAGFKKDVQKYYGIDTNQGYCHLTGVWDRGIVKAAHLVPKGLSTDEISDLFGVEQIDLTDPRNGLSLHKNIEEGLDSGRIVIVPFSQDTGDTTTATRWKCVLTDKSQKDNMIIQQSSWYWRDLHNRELTFLNDNRPARRYLYFRFIVTYIFRKKTDAESDFVQNVETKGLWATPGPYLRNSMLNVLSRSISGHDQPPPILEGSTFTDEEYPPERNPSFSGSLAAHGIRRAVVNSAKEREHEDDTTDSGSDENDFDVL